MVVPLTHAQSSAVQVLVTRLRIEQVPVDLTRARAFLAQAERALADLPNMKHQQNRYNLAYDAAHDVGEAMLATYGYRTTSGPGQHDALGRFLAAVFDTPPENAASRHHDYMRRERNQQRYAAALVTEASAVVAAQAAQTLHTAGTQRVGP